MISTTDNRTRFFTEPIPPLQARLEEFLEALAASLRALKVDPATTTLLLAGGYGRGEGGIFRTSPDAEPELYNDLEFYLLTKGGRPSWLNEWEHRWAHKGEEETGIEVEFKWMSREGLVAGGPTMFTYDLLAGHEPVFGETAWLDELPASLRAASAIPLSEATRLLFNRGSSHYFARYALDHDTERASSGYVERLQGKIKLALGDAVLTALGRYHWSCRERQERLLGVRAETCRTDAVPDSFDEICEWHALGVEFKLRPTHPEASRDAVEKHHAELRSVWEETFLWIESRRLNTTFTSLADYASYPRPLLTESPAWKNIALRVRDRIKRGGCLGRWTEYPRSVLLRVLARLQQLERSPEDWVFAAKDLGVAASSETPVHDAFRQWWLFYN